MWCNTVRCSSVPYNMIMVWTVWTGQYRLDNTDWTVWIGLYGLDSIMVWCVMAAYACKGVQLSSHTSPLWITFEIRLIFTLFSLYGWLESHGI